jgi:hypothetical protein
MGGADAAERALDCAGLSDLGAGRRLRERAGVFGRRRKSSPFRLGHFFAQLL